jgi:hypothetical protein
VVEIEMKVVTQKDKQRLKRELSHRLEDQDAALSRLKPEFESLWGHRIHIKPVRIPRTLRNFWLVCVLNRGID